MPAGAQAGCAGQLATICSRVILSWTSLADMSGRASAFAAAFAATLLECTEATGMTRMHRCVLTTLLCLPMGAGWDDSYCTQLRRHERNSRSPPVFFTRRIFSVRPGLSATFFSTRLPSSGNLTRSPSTYFCFGLWYSRSGHLDGVVQQREYVAHVVEDHRGACRDDTIVDVIQLACG